MPFRLHRAAIAVASALVLVALSVTPANATEPAGAARSGLVSPTQSFVPMFGVVTQIKVVNKSRIASNYVNTRQELGSCKALSAGVGCSINKTSSATRSIDLSLGISRSGVAGALGISSSATRSVGVTCDAPKLKSGQRLVSYPSGNRYRYKVNKMQARNGTVLANTTSGWLYAFDPHPAGMACRII